MRDSDREVGNGCVMQATGDQQSTANSEKSELGVTIPRHAARTALRVAEQAVDDITRTLRDAEQQRDDLARRLGDAQRKVDTLTGEMNYRTRHVRDLSAAADPAFR